MQYLCTKNKNFARKQPTKPIIFDAPKDRYILDLSDIPYFIDINNQKQYIFNIVEHFSVSELNFKQ